MTETTRAEPNTAANPVLDRLLRHMAWANQQILASLQDLPEANLQLHPPKEPEWTVAEITRHFVRSAGIYGHRLGAEVVLLPFDPPAPTESIADLAAALSGYDAILREQSQLPEHILPHTRPDGVAVTRARSTILAQAIHHATEHRAQISGILAGQGIGVIDLDELDVWAFGDAEGLGE